MPQQLFIENESVNNGVVTRIRVEFVSPNYIYSRFVDNILQETRPATQAEADLLINLNIKDKYVTDWDALENSASTIKVWIAEANNIYTNTWDGMTTAQRFAVTKEMINRLAKVLNGLLLVMSHIKNKIL